MDCRHKDSSFTQTESTMTILVTDGGGDYYYGQLHYRFADLAEFENGLALLVAGAIGDDIKTDSGYRSTVYYITYWRATITTTAEIQNVQLFKSPIKKMNLGVVAFSWQGSIVDNLYWNYSSQILPTQVCALANSTGFIGEWTRPQPQVASLAYLFNLSGPGLEPGDSLYIFPEATDVEHSDVLIDYYVTSEGYIQESSYQTPLILGQYY